MHILKVSENRVLRRIFGPKKEEITGRLRKLHNENLHVRPDQGVWDGSDIYTVRKDIGCAARPSDGIGKRRSNRPVSGRPCGTAVACSR
jgi:hypothetical protein